MIATSYSPNIKADFRPLTAVSQGAGWMHAPWMAALLIAPLWFGGVSESARVVVSLLIASSLLLGVGRVRCIPESKLGRVAVAGMIGVILASFLPGARALGGSKELLSIAAEDGFTLSFAPGATLTRAWELAMLAGCLALAREAVQMHGFIKWFSRGLAAGMILLGASEIWRLADGRGVWNEVRHYPAGTFANRNHFANWMVAGTMFTLGALLRKIKARAEQTQRDRVEMGFYAVALLVAIGTVMACGSRGGLLALMSGFCAWALILWRRNTHGIALGAFGVVAASGVVVFAFAGETVMARVTEGGLQFKMQIWREALSIFAEFPFLGIGLGAFADVFSIFKTFHGEGSVLFAENEFVQWLVEVGSVGTVFGLAAIFCAASVIAKGFRAERLAKGDLFHGAVAALVAVMVHACFEFVFQVTATALLAAALLGLAAGMAQRGGRTVEPLALKSDVIGTLLLALMLGGLGIQQARATQFWSEAGRERALEMTRRAMAGGSYGEARAILERALRWHPYHWELRAESAWLELAVGSDVNVALEEARKAMATNPLQPKLPLRFAATLAALHPSHALEVARLAPAQKYDDVREALRIGWMIEPNAALLWELAPPTSEGLRALAQFAREQNLTALAGEADRKQIDDRRNRH